MTPLHPHRVNSQSGPYVDRKRGDRGVHWGRAWFPMSIGKAKVAPGRRGTTVVPSNATEISTTTRRVRWL